MRSRWGRQRIKYQAVQGVGMKGYAQGLYECAGCNDEYHVSDEFAFGGGFMPAAIMPNTDHPMYWRGDVE